MEMQVNSSIIRIPPHHYIHVLDQNTNIARVEIGPLTYIRQDNERRVQLRVPLNASPETRRQAGTRSDLKRFSRIRLVV